MTRIEQLIESLCPNGVPYMTVGSLLTTIPTPRGVKVSDYTLGTRIPIVDQGQALIAGYSDDETRLIPRGHYIVFGDHTRAVKWVDFPFMVGADGTKVLMAAENLIPKFAYYSLLNLDIPNRGYNRHWTVLRAMVIPVPPLEVQQKIVRILDKFTQLEAELEAELEARQKQYAHYRKQLINEVTIEGEWVKLGDVLENFDRLRRPVTRAARKHGPYPYYGANGIQDYVDQYLFDGTFLLMGEDGSVSREDGSPVLSWASGKFWVNNHAHVLHARDERILLRFAYHFLQTVDITRYVTGSAQPKLNQKNMNAIPIVIPRLEAQEYVVRVLDNFDVITTGLSSGLPAEILARRKQYEYYRDRLLTFKELVA